MGRCMIDPRRSCPSSMQPTCIHTVARKSSPSRARSMASRPPMCPHPWVLMCWYTEGRGCEGWNVLSECCCRVAEERGRVTTERRGRGDVVVSQEVLYVTRSFLFFCTRKREGIDRKVWLPVGLGLLFSALSLIFQMMNVREIQLLA